MPNQPITFNLLIPRDHPALPGHFPGHPLVPGALLLSLLSAQIEQQLHRTVQGAAKVRFSQAIQPEQLIHVSCTTKGSNEIRFRCEAQETGSDSARVLVAKGLFILAEEPIDEPLQVGAPDA